MKKMTSNFEIQPPNGIMWLPGETPQL